ncbi:MAG: vWA domain-containing protein [Ignavibacteriaceae bacterium]
MIKYLVSFLICAALIIGGCSKSDTNPVTGGSTDNSDIPADPSGATVPVTTVNNIQPTATFQVTSGNTSRIKLNLTGLVNPTTNNPITLTAQSNFWLSEDGKVKGLKLTKVSTSNVLKADLVFTVDVSGSMGEEADAIANSIIAFSQALAASGLDVQFGVVGYYGDVEGAINLTSATNIQTFLNRSTGTYRSVGFSGADSAALQTVASTYAAGHSSVSEDGVVGILFANSNFSWRTGAQRIFINFTDEPTQPYNMSAWSTATLGSTIGGQSTVHTVWSGTADTANAASWSNLVYERPWEMSQLTGGTVVLVNANASNLTLSTLPVAGALSNSYLVEFLTSDPNVTHTVIITVKESSADGKKTYSVKYQ